MYARDITQVGASGRDDHAVKVLRRSDSAQTLRPRRAKVHHEASAATTARYSNGSINYYEIGYTLFPRPSCPIIGVHLYYSSGNHFSGMVSDGSIQLYDFGPGEYYSYSV